MAQNSTFHDAITQEKSIFRQFNSFKELDEGAVAFLSPESQEVPHWNMIYPADLNRPISVAARASARAYYERQNIQGHVLSVDASLESLSREVSEYFVYEPTSSNTESGASTVRYKLVLTVDLEMFANVMGEAFEFSSQTRAYFLEKVRKLSANVRSQFFLIEQAGTACGTASLFETQDGSQFLFNFSVLREFRNRGIGSDLLRSVVANERQRIFTYSHNPSMRKDLLPGAGFRSLGTIYVVPVCGEVSTSPKLSR